MRAATLVGEANPYSDNPRDTLHVLPRGASGDRLRAILGMTDEEYLLTFERVNLCVTSWEPGVARRSAGYLRQTRVKLVALGARVARALGLEFEPFTVSRL
jgi:hypothetical protein